MPIEIKEYHPRYQPGVDQMMEGIAAEYAEAITGPHSARLPDEYDKPGQRFWVALAGDRVVGTVGLIVLGARNAVLKRMMTDRDFRGASTGLANGLFRTAMEWACSQGCQTVYFGTMSQFAAAQKFYTKHGCEPIETEELPDDFPLNPIDAIHYRHRLRPE